MLQCNNDAAKISNSKVLIGHKADGSDLLSNPARVTTQEVCVCVVGGGAS